MASDTDPERVWNLMEKIGFCMLATRDGEDIRARPMAAHVEPAENAVYFLTDVKDHKDDEINAESHVCLAFADAGDQKYVSVTGVATVRNDRAKIRDLFSAPAKAWWDSSEDPSIRLLKVVPKDAQYWDSPGTVVSYVKMLAAAIGDSRPDMGDNAKVRM
ncbi:pyridoxamine 5'-phosphate oxidase family protein [Pseudaminobacter sp. 19-2017]|uniref:Pyridoxamine 5'-phosphate oxidase family protein n=1 Tax=Pseudaminobacter soli (ex Zhang et al. 2022) TaxID=2831468 RepID=A0A942IA06_9HYPH|nr:pyridoxamine 5'-phosphate oxidase family protein [Pseudaminobacter soli]MBS3650855.1 pyridoxamine 5'-phosphate oxidase family protein [Pseudaminobacter soli]